ncbi:MAG: SOS response-associated peptidase [Planctomycetota bacterium]|nr:SOS response-associated peptidase [Planctomycetota bacterium]
MNQKANLIEVADLFSVDETLTDFAQQKDLFPLVEIPVVRMSPDGARELVACSWGLLPFWWKPSAKQKSFRSFQRMTFNARGETIHEKPTFRAAFKSRRCLIPWTEFFEHGWYFSLHDRQLSAFAGLWELWNDPDSGESLESCTIVTTAANELLEKYHPKKRMPVILDGEDACQRWLNPDIVDREPLDDLFKPLSSARLAHWPAE